MFFFLGRAEPAAVVIVPRPMHTIILASAWAGGFAALAVLATLTYISAHTSHMCSNMRGVKRCLMLWEHCNG